MRFFEFCADDPNNRKANLSLRHIHTLKQVHQKRRGEFAARKKLMGLMYGRNDEALDAREAELNAKERELELLKSEVEVMIDRAEIDSASRRKIQKMAANHLDRK